jgi:hypothetical protein
MLIKRNKEGMIMKMSSYCFNKIIFTVFCLLALVYSQHGYALTAQIEIVIGCEASSLVANWCRIDGEPDMQYSLTTKGLKVDENMVNCDYKIKPINVLARCIPPFAEVDMFPSPGAFPTITCPKGYGLEVAMIQPNDPNPNKYQYVGILTMTQDEKEKFNNTINNISTGNAQIEKGLAALSISSSF